MDEWMSVLDERDFPNLVRSEYKKTSEATDRYNCLAWAANDTDRWWEPALDGVFDPGQYWPGGAPPTIRLDSLIKAYELHGFEICDAFQSESRDCDTIALYAYPDGDLAHAAKLDKYSGSWSSKLGEGDDIRHDYLIALEGDYPAYGYVRVLMRRYNPA